MSGGVKHVSDKHFQRSAEDAFLDNPDVALTSIEYLRGMRGGKWSPGYIDLLMQLPDIVGGYSLYDAYAFAQFHTMIQTGKLAVCKVDVGVTPSMDTDIAVNNARLSAINSAFKAEFWSGKRGADGSLSWGEPITVNVYGRTKQSAELPPGRLPLEIGYTSARTTFQHIRLHAGVARWPYDATVITILWALGGDERQ